jgi:hypothetical protein
MVKARPAVESLESRLVLYNAPGDVWPNPQLITISFMPDGTNIGGVASNLQANLNKNLAGRWQNIILQAAQTWAAQTNINFAVVSDNGAAQGSGVDEQGNPGFGDIRIGGYNFGPGGDIADTYLPPPIDNFDPAGDVMFNTAMPFNAGRTYDLMTVALHELGHSIGLGDSTTSPTNPAAVEWTSYNGIKTTLSADDINGAQHLYGGARAPDAYNSGGASDGSISTAANLNSLINQSSLTALVQNLDLNTIGRSEYFTFNAPSATTGTLKLNVQSSGLSLLSPNVTVYGPNGQAVLASASGLNQYGTTLSLTVSGVTANEQLYVKVQGADSTVFSTGNYAMTLNFGTGASPTVPLPNTTVPNGSPLNLGGGEAEEPPGHGHHHHAHPRGPLGITAILKAGSASHSHHHD